MIFKCKAFEGDGSTLLRVGQMGEFEGDGFALLVGGEWGGWGFEQMSRELCFRIIWNIDEGI